MFQYRVLTGQSLQNVLKQQVTYSGLVHCYFELFMWVSVLGSQIKSFSDLAFQQMLLYSLCALFLLLADRTTCRWYIFVLCFYTTHVYYSSALLQYGNLWQLFMLNVPFIHRSMDTCGCHFPVKLSGCFLWKAKKLELELKIVCKQGLLKNKTKATTKTPHPGTPHKQQKLQTASVSHSPTPWKLKKKKKEKGREREKERKKKLWTWVVLWWS